MRYFGQEVAVANLMVLNLVLFLVAVVAGFVPAWIGWRLTRPDGGNEDGGRDGGRMPWPRPKLPSPVEPRAVAGRDELAGSA